ncbi:mannosyltransferase family protein [Nigerium massiliense]|uniref:mannosyltransferase family protein n=1 Tax=Nigerium massiliense TaxID=1522317 RepID=UPI001F36AF50|nr:mannosyltransferase family protein [Nigerium massiliense]
MTRLLFAVVALAVVATTGSSLTTVLGQWDVAHFAAIAENGYAVEIDRAFFPGLPLLMRVGMGLGASPQASGVVIALICSALATWALYRLGGRLAAIAWLLAPTSVFTAVGYTESPFCAAAFWAWERASNKCWGQAAVLAALACTLRVSGLFLIGALAILALTQRGRVRLIVRRLAWLLLPAATLFGYVLFLYTETGSWTAWFSAQAAGWERGFHWPWEAFWNSWQSLQPGMYPEHPEWVWIFRGEMVSVFVGLAVAIVALAKRRIAESAWVAVQVLAFSLSYWFQSVNRAVLLWFPLWTQIAEFVETRRHGGWRAVWALVALAALALQGVWAWLFFSGRWAS